MEKKYKFKINERGEFEITLYEDNGTGGIVTEYTNTGKSIIITDENGKTVRVYNYIFKELV